MIDAATATEHRADVDGLRGIAVLSVFAVHSIPDALRGGFIGVDVFFVISGYLIARITLAEASAGHFSIAGFFARRIRRLAPALLVVLVTCLAFAALFAYPLESKALGKHVMGGAAFVSNLVLWREAGYFDPSSDTKPLLHLWSLGIEEQFYIVWPLAVVLLSRLRGAGIVLVAAATLASFALNITFVAEKPKGVFFLPPTRFWEILIGVLLAQWVQRTPGGPADMVRRCMPATARWHARVPDLLSIAGVTLLATSVVAINKTALFPGWWALMPTLGTALLIAAGARAWINRAVLSHPVLTFYGRISYPLYLWHWPLLSFPLLLDRRLSAEQQVLLLCASVVLATATYYLVEKPLRHGRLARAAPPMLSLGLIVAAGLGWQIFQTDGLLDRFPESVRPIARVQVQTDYERYRIERCFLRAEQGPANFAEECVPRREPARPLLLVWGDSHAAALYPGLSAPTAPGASAMRIAQYTAAACPPGHAVHAPANPHCSEVNNFVLKRIDELRPAAVVLAANWSAHGSAEAETFNGGWSLVDDLVRTVAVLHERGVHQVIVFGPLPHWHLPPPNLLLSAWSETGTLPTLSDRALDAETLQLDRRMERSATAAGARYISAIATLCEARGCTLSVGDGSHRQAVAFDRSHLTAAGSMWLIEQIAPQIGH